MNKSNLINKISTESKYISICRRLTKGRDHKDLHQELILHFLEKSEELISKIEKPDAYIYRTLLSLISKRGKFHNKYRTYICEDGIEPVEDENYNDAIDEQYSKWQDTSGSIYWCDREIFNAYIEKGSIRQTAEDLNIPLSSTKRIIDRTKQKIKYIMTSKPKILIMMQHNVTALQYYRQIIPHERINTTNNEEFEFIYNRPGTPKDEASIMWMTDEELKEYKAVIFLRQISMGKDLIQPSIDRLKSFNIKIIFDIDDYWELPKNHTWYDSFIRNNIAERTTSSIAQCDYVTTTTSTFSDVIYHVNKNVSIIPNCIHPEDKQFTPIKIENNRIRFAWIGGVFHRSDIKLMSDSIKRLYESKELSNKWQLCVGGYNPNVEYIEIERVFTANYDFKTTDKTYYDYLMMQTPLMEHVSYDKPYRRLWGKSIEQYGTLYNETDVCLIPLEDNKFNNCKSELKIVEAGWMKKAVIVSNTSPYKQWIKNGVNGLVVEPGRDYIDWFVQMRKLILNPNMIEDMGNKLRETIINNFDMDEHNKNRINLYKQIIK